MFRSEPLRSDAPSIVISAVPDPTPGTFQTSGGDTARQALRPGPTLPDRQLTRRQDLCGGRMDGATDVGQPRADIARGDPRRVPTPSI